MSYVSFLFTVRVVQLGCGAGPSLTVVPKKQKQKWCLIFFASLHPFVDVRNGVLARVDTHPSFPPPQEDGRMAWRADGRAPRILAAIFERLADLDRDPDDVDLVVHNKVRSTGSALQPHQEVHCFYFPSGCRYTEQLKQSFFVDSASVFGHRYILAVQLVRQYEALDFAAATTARQDHTAILVYYCIYVGKIIPVW